MSHFHFRFTDGFCDSDKEGVELNDLAAAQRAAIQFIGQALLDKPNDFWTDGRWQLTVTDDESLVLFTIHVFASVAPVLQIAAKPTAPAAT